MYSKNNVSSLPKSICHLEEQSQPSTNIAAVLLDSIPNELKALPNWVCWKATSSKGRKIKLPINPVSGKPAKSDDRQTWSDFGSAVASSDRFDGIGFEFSPPYVGIDLDGCRNPDTGEVDAWAEEIVRLIDSYTEVSPSGTGLHIIVRSVVPGERHRAGGTGSDGQKRGFEIYTEGRYFTVTGQQLPGTPADIGEKNLLAAYLFGMANPDRAEDQKFRKLFLGDWSGDYKSQSEADLALCHLLAKKLDGEVDQIDLVFRSSHLFRSKWDERHGENTYGARTIKTALKTFSPSNDGAPAVSDEALALMFTERHQNELRYVAAWGRWYMWDGTRWKHDRTLHVFDRSRSLCRDVSRSCGKRGSSVASAKTVSAVEHLAAQIAAMRRRLNSGTAILGS